MATAARCSSWHDLGSATCPKSPGGAMGDPCSRLQGRISYPAWLCRLKNYELLKFCNINDCSHLLIWQPETSQVVLCSVRLLKHGIFGAVGSWESCSLGLAQQWAVSCSYHCSGGTYGQCQCWLMQWDAVKHTKNGPLRRENPKAPPCSPHPPLEAQLLIKALCGMAF